MKIYTQITEMQSELKDVRLRKMSIGLVPTLGFLHEGHLSLVRESLRRTDITVVSIFVNPAQFGPQEDFNDYPRDLKHDSKILEKEGVDYLFVPSTEIMYPEGYKTYAEVQELQDKLCGRSRPEHFRGVCTVVLKLFNIIRPDISFFGQKDAQQAILLNKMVEDLNLDTAVEVLPVIREKDGLALSSRNGYLNPEERKAALVLSRSLREAQAMIEQGERESAPIIQKMREIIAQEPLAKIDYAEIVNMNTLDHRASIDKEALIALAVYIGKIRLIDNAVVRLKE